jgi:hypothetical protein
MSSGLPAARHSVVYDQSQCRRGGGERGLALVEPARSLRLVGQQQRPRAREAAHLQGPEGVAALLEALDDLAHKAALHAVCECGCEWSLRMRRQPLTV